MLSTRTAAPPRLATLFTALFAIGGWGVGLARLSDNSFLWHLRTGHLILDQGIPRADPYSFTVPGAKWVAQSWLAEAAYAVADNLWGPWGIRLLMAATGGALGLLGFRLTLRLAGDRVRAASLFLVAFAAVMTVWSERPLVLGLLATVALCWVVEVPGSWVGRRPVVVLPALMWLWANVHGTFALGFAFLGLHLVGRWADGHPPWSGRERDLAAGGGLGLLAIALNPYGIDLLLFPVRLVLRGETLGDVAEWRSPDFRSTPGMIVAAWIAVFVVTSIRSASRPSRRDLVVALPFLLLMLWAVRNVGISALVMLPAAARAVAAPAREETPSRLGWAMAAGLLALAIVLTAGAFREPDYDLGEYPVAALAAVADRGLLGAPMFTTDAWAGYVISRDWPEQRVFLDDRYDMYPRSVVDDYDTVSEPRPGWEQVLERTGVRVVVWKPDRGLSQVLAVAPGWSLLHADDVAVVYVRDDD